MTQVQLLFLICNFDETAFRDATFLNCKFKNCSLKNCSFEKAKRGSLSKAWFESCHFIETNFNHFNFGSLIATTVKDSKFSKFNKTIEFQSKFFLIDILKSKTGTHTQDDVTWIKHEFAERHHQLKYGSSYNETYNRAQTRFNVTPWENQF